MTHTQMIHDIDTKQSPRSTQQQSDGMNTLPTLDPNLKRGVNGL